MPKLKKSKSKSKKNKKTKPGSHHNDGDFNGIGVPLYDQDDYQGQKD
jgi:hypothetical protein